MRILAATLAACLVIGACAPRRVIAPAPVADPRVPSSVQQRAAHSVYLIHFETEGGKGACTGWLLATHRVMTAAHCVGHAMEVDGILVDKVLGFDEQTDLALLAVDLDGAPLPIRESQVVLGEWVASLGYAFGWHSLTMADVQVKHIDLSPGRGIAPGLLVMPGLIGGMSGGPMIDGAGRVVAVNQRAAEGVGYGVGSLILRAFLVGLDVAGDSPRRASAAQAQASPASRHLR